MVKVTSSRSVCVMLQCEPYLHVFVFDLLAGGDTVGDVEMDELWRQVHSGGQPGDTFTTQVSDFSLHCPQQGETCTCSRFQESGSSTGN